MWRDTGNSRYLADTLGRDTLPLADGGLRDAKGRRQLGGATGLLDGFSEGIVGHKQKVSRAYKKVNEAFIAPSIRTAYTATMLGETIRRLRKARHLTQKQVAEAMGVTPPAVTQWEADGGIDLNNLKKLAKTLGTSAKVLVEVWERDNSERNSDQSAENLPDSDISKGNNAHVTEPTQPREETGMRDDGVRGPYLEDILARLRRLEAEVFQSGAQRDPTEDHPQKRGRA